MSSDPRGDGHFIEPPTPFHDAARGGDVETLRRLLDAGADPNEEDWTGAPPLDQAVHGGSAEAVRVLLEAGADPNGGASLTSPLVGAAGKNRVDLVMILLDAGANPHRTDPQDGGTALMLAAFHGNLAMIDLLLALGVSPNVVASKGWTALRYAVESGHQHVVARLKAAGAVEPPDAEGLP
jgi:ankyrin repeat protein